MLGNVRGRRADHGTRVSASEALSDAIHDASLYNVAVELANQDLAAPEAALVARALASCAGVQSACEAARSEALEALARDIQVHVASEALDGAQTHRFAVQIAANDLARAVETILTLGYRELPSLNGAQRALQARFAERLVLVRDDSTTMRAVLEWAPQQSRIPTVLRPRLEDARYLPASMWWFSFLTRPVGIVVRAISRKQGLRGEFLGTPRDLLPELLSFAELGVGERLFDLGCGDARVLIDAATRVGAQGVGYEIDPLICAQARAAIASAGVGERVIVHEADASNARIEDADVVFLFLPVEEVARAVPELLVRLKSGARIIAHEQSRLSGAPTPRRSRPLFGPASMTVAHCWVA